MPQRFYPAVLERGAKGVFGVWFPDFPGCVAAAKSQEEAMAKAQDALASSIQRLAELDRVLPEPTALAEIAIPSGCDMIGFFAVGAALPNPSERVNVYLPKALIERVDRVASDTGMSRSSLFGLAVTRLLDTSVLSAFPAAGSRIRPAAAPAKRRRS
ncbi:MAG TPA: type II toxin-antitoxin system HicB family antitoxin [Caulobacteraceae bacterium]